MSKGTQRPPGWKGARTWGRRQRAAYRQRSFMGKVMVWGVFGTFLGLGVGLGAWVAAPSEDDVVDRLLERSEEFHLVMSQEAAEESLRRLEAEVKMAVLLDPWDEEAYFELGVLLAGTGRHEEAEAAFQRSIGLKPDSRSFLHLGYIFARDGRLEEAEKANRASTAMDNFNLRSRFHLGLLLWVAGDFRQAERELEWALSRGPKYGSRWKELELVYRRVQVERARRHAQIPSDPHFFPP